MKIIIFFLAIYVYIYIIFTFFVEKRGSLSHTRFSVCVSLPEGGSVNS